MYIVISPAKTIVNNLPCSADHVSKPEFGSDANKLIEFLKAYRSEDLQQLMGISPKLALLNYERFQSWEQSSQENLKAICAFKGEVFNGLKAWEFSSEQLQYSQNHLAILSGLFGILRPLDTIKPYRLEMGTELDFGSLYEFWGDKITNKLNELMKIAGGPLINLASKEYFRAINLRKLNYEVVTPEFKEFKNGKYVIVAIYAKKMRGLMSRFILENELQDIDDLKAFQADGYYYNSRLSTSEKPVFTREK